ncbi:MAG: hypothetical protein ACC645_25670, partial [Pirellulales bacterium]
APWGHGLQVVNMTQSTVTVTAPSRLHFGLFAFDNGVPYQFGGVGVMVGHPRTRLVLRPAERFVVRGAYGDRLRRHAVRAAQIWDLPQLPRCSLELTEYPEQHVGLGSGTQLGLSVVAGLNALLGRPPLGAEALAHAAGRAARSAVGTHGFLWGGLIVEMGKRDAGALGVLAGRVELPGSWRFTLLLPAGDVGLSGDAERRAFASLPAVSTTTTEQLIELARGRLMPDAACGRFADFSDALYEYGCLAGECFASWQGGPFASPQLARLVQRIRGHGVCGVGQSSWGPTLFALLPGQQEAESFVDALQRECPSERLDAIITAASQTGARIDVVRGPSCAGDYG